MQTPLVGLIQEPYTIGEKTPNFLKSNAISSGHEPRAIIINNKNLDIWLQPNLSNRDFSVAVWKTGQESIPYIVLASCYLDITYDMNTNIDTLNDILNFSNRKGWPLLIDLDSNAHSEMWGSEKANHRGEILEEWITQNRISVSNYGRKPTFLTARASSIIDLTLSTKILDEYILNWRVEDYFQLSDHRLISFSISIPTGNPILKRPVAKTNWDIFTEELNKSKSTPPEIWNKETIDAVSQVIERDITRAFNRACPIREIRPQRTHLKWWTQELTTLRKEVRILGQKARRTNDLVSWETYRGKRNVYKYAIRKAKTTGWAKFLAKAESAKEVSIINKIVYKSENRKLGLLKNSRGQCT